MKGAIAVVITMNGLGLAIAFLAYDRWLTPTEAISPLPVVEPQVENPSSEPQQVQPERPVNPVLIFEPNRTTRPRASSRVAQERQREQGRRQAGQPETIDPLEEDESMAWMTSADRHVLAGDFSAAVDDYRAALFSAQTDEAVALAKTELANAHIQLGNYTRSINLLTEVITTSPSSRAHERRGEAMFRLRQYPDALTDFAAAMRFVDENTTAALNGAAAVFIALYNEGYSDPERRLAAARRLWMRSLDRDPDQPEIIDLLDQYSE